MTNILTDLQILQNSILQIYTEDINTTPSLEIWSKFKASNSEFETLEIIIQYWSSLVSYSFHSFHSGHKNILRKNKRHKLLHNRLNVPSLVQVNLEQLIMSSDLSQLEKEYLKLKYFV